MLKWLPGQWLNFFLFYRSVFSRILKEPSAERFFQLFSTIIMKFRFILLSVLVVSFASCLGGNHQPVGRPPASKAYLISPGASVGNIAIGENLDSVAKQMGKADLSDAAMGGKVIDTWYLNHDTSAVSLSVYAVDTSVDRTGRQWVRKIRVSNPAYRTQEGVGAGDSLINIARMFVVRPIDTFRYEKILYTTFGTQRGMTFVINPKGVCQSIIVYPPAEGDSSAYVPFY